MAKKIDILNKQFTERGLKDYKALTKTLVRLYNEKTTFPMKQMVLGFGRIQLDSKESCAEWIKCMLFLVGGQLAKTTQEEVLDNGEKKITELLEYVEVQ